MAITTTLRFGLTQWSAGTDPYRREHVDSSFREIEIKGAGYLQGVGTPTAGPEYTGFFFFDTDTNTLFYCDGTQWWIIVGAEGGFGSPSALTISTTSGSSGSSLQASRSDHVHPMPGFAVPVSVGTALNPGTGETVARSDHVHNVGAGSINDANMIANEAITAAALAPGAIENAELASSSVSNAKIADNAVATAKLQDGSVTEAKLANGAVTNNKVGDMDASKINAGVFPPERIPDLDASIITSGTINSNQLPISTYIPPGAIVMHSELLPPLTSGTWLRCDGSAVSREAYVDLNDLLADQGYPFGNGDGSTTFNVPNFTGRMPLGLRASGSGSAMGNTGGSFDHTHTGALHAHSVNPASTASTSDGAHTHGQTASNSNGSHSHSVGNTTTIWIGSAVNSDGTVGLVSQNDIIHSHSHSHGDGSYDTNNSFGGSGSVYSHDHSISGSSSSSTPSYTPANRSWTHYHSNSNTDTEASHAHDIVTTGSDGAHTHNLDIAAFDSDNGSSLGANNSTSAANPPYLAVPFFIKT